MNRSVVRLVERAEKFGVSTLNRRGREVYKIYNTGTYFKLVHYGTLILNIRLKDKFVANPGGYSKSDQDAINTVLDYYNIDKIATRRGGILRVVNRHPTACIYCGKQSDTNVCDECCQSMVGGANFA